MILGLGLYREAYLKFLLIASPAFALLLARRSDRAQPNGCGIGRGSRAAAAPAETASDCPGGRASSPLSGALRLIAVVSSPGWRRPWCATTPIRASHAMTTAASPSSSGRRRMPNDAILLTAPGQQEVFDYYYHGDRLAHLTRCRASARWIRADDTGRARQAAWHDKVYAILLGHGRGGSAGRDLRLDGRPRVQDPGRLARQRAPGSLRDARTRTRPKRCRTMSTCPSGTRSACWATVGGI